MLHEARTQDISADPKEVDDFVNQIQTQTCPQLPIPEAQETDQTKLWDACAGFFGFENGAAFRRYLQEEVVLSEIGKRRLANSEEIHAAHILVQTEEEARAARERVTTGGEDFAAVARELSIEPQAKESGGDLGFFGPGAMVAPFEQAAFTLKDGEISQPVQTQFGWHVIKVIERRKQQDVSAQAAAQASETYRRELLEKGKQEGRVQYLITPAPAPTQEPPPLELPTVEVEPEGTVAPAQEGLDTTPTPAP
jgi:parvulin-like peptidyl-prolyl isomerase